eukprot:TRINITY_DN12909_c0_g1_i1.p1 TRINITY_DN12909_c0_g1~~TRINITY_DN12909_c0_g1_i1.p1  ORF type:complete len:765 (+),score=174.74 TRINITY_DN12909_c0_g1_i1:133-2295(+)
MEIIIFTFAFLMHITIFGKHGLLKQKARGDKAASSTDPIENGNTLARSLSSLVNESQDVEVNLQLTGLEKLDEVKELIAAAGPETELQIVVAAVQKQRKDVLRRFFASYPVAGAAQPSQTLLLKRLVRKGLGAEALECVKALPPKSYLYNAVLEALVEKKDVEAIKQVIACAENADAADLASHNSLIKVLAQLGKIDLAKQALHDLKKIGFKPNHASFNSILEAVVKTGMNDCWLILGDMKDNGLKPTNATCSILLKGIQKGCREETVQRVMKAVEEREGSHEIEEGLLASFCEALTRSGHVHQMLGYLNKFRQKGDGCLQVRCAHSIGSIIRAYGVAGDVQSVWATWRDMERNKVQPTRITLGCMVEALASNNDAEGAHAIIRKALMCPATKGLVNAVMYSSVLKSLSHQKDFKRVWAVYDEMIREKVEFTASTYNSLLDVCARSGDIARAEVLLKDMTEQGIEPTIITYGAVLKAYCSVNRMNQAFALMDEMKRNTQHRPDEVAYNTLLDGCARYGLFERGLEVLGDMRKEGLPPSNYTLSVVAKLANRSKKPEQAFELVNKLKNEFGLQLNVHTYNNLIQAAVFNDDMAKAQEVFASMLSERVRPDGRTYVLLLRFAISKKDSASAVALLRVASGLPQLPPWKKQGQQGLHLPMLAALQRLPSASWAAAPRRGTGALQDDMMKEVRHFLMKCPDQIQPEQVSMLFRDVQAAMPGLKL